MIYTEEIGDLFTVDSKYSKVQCISLDCAMGAGIAVMFNQHYPDMKEYCKKVVAENKLTVPCVIPYVTPDHVVFNLVTKKLRWHKPTYVNMLHCTEDLLYLCTEFFQIKYLALPTIGCGLDKLDWGIVSRQLCRTFESTDIEILVRKNV